MSRATDRRNQEEALRKSIDTHNRCVDLIYASAIAAVRIADCAGLPMETADVPRLCISAACQTLEKLIARYEAAVSGRIPTTEDERASIIAASQDLVDACETGKKAAEAFAAFARGDKGAPSPSGEGAPPAPAVN